METLSSKEYASKIAETVEEHATQKAYEANLIAMGKDAPNQIEDAFKAGKALAVKHIMDLYKSVKEHYADKEGLTFECFDVILAEAANDIMEELNEY